MRCALAKRGAFVIAGSPAVSAPAAYATSATHGRTCSAVQPAGSDRFALVLPQVSAEAMQMFLEGFSKMLAPDEHAAMVIDGAEWHVAKDLLIPTTSAWFSCRHTALN